MTKDALVWGFSLLDVALNRGMRTLWCRELETDDQASCLEVALRMENRRGCYTWPERERIFHFIKEARPWEQALPLIPLIERENPAGWVTRMEAFSAFPGPLKELIARNLLDFKTGMRVASMPDMVFTKLLQAERKVSFSERRKIVHWLWEIAKRDGLDSDAITDLFEQALAAENTVTSLHEQRFPEMTRLESRFSTISAPLAAQGISVEHPQDFEGEQVFFKFSCISSEIYQKRLRALADFEENVDELFKLL